MANIFIKLTMGDLLPIIHHQQIILVNVVTRQTSIFSPKKYFNNYFCGTKNDFPSVLLNMEVRYIQTQKDKDTRFSSKLIIELYGDFDFKTNDD